MQNNVQNDTQYDDEIDLRELFGVLWAGSRKIIAITVVFAFVSVIYALSIPNQYKATALLAPAQSDSSDLSGALGQLGGLASLAGVDIGGGKSNEGQIAQEIMKSWSFKEGFIVDKDLAVELCAVQGWSKESNELLINDGVYDTENKQWLSKNECGVTGPPSSWVLFEAFSERLGWCQCLSSITLRRSPSSGWICMWRPLTRTCNNAKWKRLPIILTTCRIRSRKPLSQKCERFFTPLLKSRRKIRWWLRPALNMPLWR